MRMILTVFIFCFCFGGSGNAQTPGARESQVTRIAEEFKISRGIAELVLLQFLLERRLRESDQARLADEVQLMGVGLVSLGQFELSVPGIQESLRAGVSGTPVPDPLAERIRAATLLYLGGMNAVAQATAATITQATARATLPCRTSNHALCREDTEIALAVLSLGNLSMNILIATATTLPSWVRTRPVAPLQQ